MKPFSYANKSIVRIPLTLFLIIVWTFLILAPLNALAEDKILTCKAVIAGVPKSEGNFYLEVEEQARLDL